MSVSPITTYTSLKNTLLKYAQRQGDSQFIDQIPYIIYMGQCRISWDLNVLGNEKIVNGLLPSSNATIPKPADWLATISFTIQDPANDMASVTLQKRLREYLKDFQIHSTHKGTPKYYADDDFNSFVFSPVPQDLPADPGYPFTLIYHPLLEALSETNQTNWITQRVPHLLLYASMADASIFFGSMDDQAKFDAIYDKALMKIKGLDMQNKSDRSQNGEIN